MAHTNKTKIIAHRGASSIAPENTLASIRAALDAGADFIEIDVRLTRDGKLAVLHDASLRRTAGLRKTVHNLTLEEVQQQDAGRWFDRKFAGEKIPSFEEVLQTVGNRAGLMVEIKQGVLPPKFAVDAVFDVIDKFSSPLPELVIGGFSLETAIGVKKMAEERAEKLQIRTIGIVERYPCIAPFLRHGVDVLAAWHPLLVPKVSEELAFWKNQKPGNEVWSFTINDNALAKKLANAGVSGLITNYPQSIRL